MKKLDLSQCRLRMRHLMQDEEKLIQIFIDTKVLLKGSVYKMMTKCGKKGCRCQREGRLHSAWRISRSHEGRSQSKCISMREALNYRKLTYNYRRFRQARAKLVRLHHQKIELVNMLQEAKKKEIFK